MIFFQHRYIILYCIYIYISFIYTHKIRYHECLSYLSLALTLVKFTTDFLGSPNAPQKSSSSSHSSSKDGVKGFNFNGLKVIFCLSWANKSAAPWVPTPATNWIIESLIRSVIVSLFFCFVHSSHNHPFLAFLDWFVHSSVDSFIRWFIHPLIHSFIHAGIRSFVHWFQLLSRNHVSKTICCTSQLQSVASCCLFFEAPTPWHIGTLIGLRLRSPRHKFKLRFNFKGAVIRASLPESVKLPIFLKFFR